MDPLPKHIWEITVQVDNGDWHYRRYPVPLPFYIVVRAAILFEETFSEQGGRLVSIANVDPKPDDGPSEAQKLHRAGYPI